MNSDRFLSMKSVLFDSLLLEMESTFDDLNFTPFTLEVFQSAKNNKSYFQELISDRIITQSRADYMNKVANSDLLKPVLEHWDKFKMKDDIIINTEYKMKDY